MSLQQKLRRAEVGFVCTSSLDNSNLENALAILRKVIRRRKSAFILMCAAPGFLLARVSAAQAKSEMPAQMMQCEPDSCGTWSFSGKNGIARWDSGAVANLTVEQFNAGTIAVRREDTTGIGKGIVGLYVGTRKDDHIEGTFTWSWPDHGALSAGTVNWIAILDAEAELPANSVPKSFSMCEDAPDHCATWTFQQRRGQGQWSNGSIADLVMGHFGASTIAVRRIDTNMEAPPRLMALYIGDRRGNHIEGTVTWLWPGHGQLTTGTTTWHADVQTGASQTDATTRGPDTSAISAVKSASAPRTIHQPTAADVRKAEEIKKMFLEDGCPRQEPSEPAADPFKMFLNGKTIQLERSDLTTDLDALRWYCRAAKAGSGEAAFEIGELYSNGIALPGFQFEGKLYSNGISPDMNKAFDWYTLAAAAHNTEGMVKLASFYRWGSRISYHSGDYSSVNQHPVDIAESMTEMRDAGNLNDTDAMSNLIEIYTSGIADPVHPVAPDPVEAARWRIKSTAAALALQDRCSTEKDAFQNRFPERVIKSIFAGSGHDHSDYCVAELYPEREDNSDGGDVGRLLEGIVSATQGDMMNYWTYMMYWKNDPKAAIPERASVRQEYMRRAIDYGIVVAAMKNASK